MKSGTKSIFVFTSILCTFIYLKPIAIVRNSAHSDPTHNLASNNITDVICIFLKVHQKYLYNSKGQRVENSCVKTLAPFTQIMLTATLLCDFKGIVHPKMKMTPWFTHPQAILGVWLSSFSQSYIYFLNVLALPIFMMNGGRDFEAQKVHKSIIKSAPHSSRC